jgi:hypothetical protein
MNGKAWFPHQPFHISGLLLDVFFQQGLGASQVSIASDAWETNQVTSELFALER